jgi:TolA-binding protein
MVRWRVVQKLHLPEFRTVPPGGRRSGKEEWNVSRRSNSAAGVFFVFFSVLLWSVASPAAALKIPFGEVGNIEGSPTVNGEIAKAGDRLFEKDLVKTDAVSTMEIRMRTGDRLTVGPSTEVVLQKAGKEKGRATRLNVKRGLLRSVVETLVKDESYEIETRTAVAGVKGTEFITFATPWAVSLFTKQGTVGVTTHTGQKGDSPQSFITQASDDIAPLQLANFETEQSARNLYELVHSLTDLEVPDTLFPSENLPDIVARFNVNYASYLLDKGEYEKALLVFELAARFARNENLQAEGIARRVVVQSRFLDDLDGALKDVNFLLNYYPDTDFREFALFQRGFIHYEKGSLDQAREYLEDYLETHPEGKYSPSAKALLHSLSDESS